MYIKTSQQQGHKSCEQLLSEETALRNIKVFARAKNVATRLISRLFVKIALKLFGPPNFDSVRWTIALHQTECPVKYFCLRKVWGHTLKRYKLSLLIHVLYVKRQLKLLYIYFSNVRKKHIYGMNFTVEYLCYSCNNVDVNFTLKTVLFGERSYTCNKPINIILLATKQHLYTCLKEGKNPNIMELLFVLHQIYEVEKPVAYKNLNSRKFTKTCGIWKTFFEWCNEIAADANSNYILCISINILYILNYDAWAYVHYTLYM